MDNANDRLESSIQNPQNTSDNRKELFTPFQVRLASFIGGPFAAVFVLHQNFSQMGNAKGKQLTVIYGALFILALVILLPILPEHFPSIAIPVMYSVVAGQLATYYQMSKEKIERSDSFRRRTGGQVAVVMIISLICFVAVFLPVYLVADMLGMMKQ